VSNFASESGHWYTREGKPCYTIIGKNGKERNTTLADARKLDLVPSVTTITKMAAAPGLEKWKTQQVLLAALTLPRLANEPEAMWLDRVMEDSKQQAILAADRGTDIHGEIEKMLRQEPADVELRPFATAAMEVVYAKYPGVEWETEKSFASPMSYGGKVDLFSRKHGIVVDFKSKDNVSNVRCWDEHFMQLAAYAPGLGIVDAKCANVFVTRQRVLEKIDVVILEHSPQETAKGWRMFMALLEYYKACKGL